MAAELDILFFPSRPAWERWLEKNHARAEGVWVRLLKKSIQPALSYSEALDAALCYGWIDALKRSESESAWLQKFNPRARRSVWSKRNRERALALMEAGRMRPAGLAEVERAKGDGRWEAAYDSSKTAEVPPDLQAALDANAGAKAFFATLDRGNRYAVLFRVQTATKPETRARRIRQFVEMLGRREKLHP
jgi:uncharacterized protein YdeI (YjbR/CyaY-like superfamily)